MSSTTITRGNLHESFIISVPFTPAALTTAAVAVYQTVAVSGLATTDIVEVLGPVEAQTVGVVTGDAYVSADNVLAVQFNNTKAAAVTPVDGPYVVRVSRSEGPLPTNAA